MAGEDAIAREAELARLLAEVGQQRSWQERAQEAAEVLLTATVKVEGLRQDWEAARLEVARLAVELAAAEAARAAAQEAMDAVQDEARRIALLPDFTPRDVEVLCALRGMVASSGMPVQDLLEALQSAVTSRAAAMEAEAAAAAAGLGADLARGGGFGGHAVVGVQEYDPETVGPTPTSPGGRRSGAGSALGLGERREQHLALRGGGTRADGDALHAHGASHGRRRPGGAGQPTGDASLLAGGGRAAGAGVAGAGWPRGARGARGGGGQAEAPLAQLIDVGALTHSCVGAAAWLLMGGGLCPKTSNGGTLPRYRWQF